MFFTGENLGPGDLVVVRFHPHPNSIEECLGIALSEHSAFTGDTIINECELSRLNMFSDGERHLKSYLNEEYRKFTQKSLKVDISNKTIGDVFVSDYFEFLYLGIYDNQDLYLVYPMIDCWAYRQYYSYSLSYGKIHSFLQGRPSGKDFLNFLQSGTGSLVFNSHTYNNLYYTNHYNLPITKEVKSYLNVEMHNLD